MSQNEEDLMINMELVNELTSNEESSYISPSNRSNRSSSFSSVSVSPLYVRKANKMYDFVPSPKYCYSNASVKSESIESYYRTCRICMEDINDLCSLRCGHVLCLQCFMNWFKENKSCPFCRKDIDVNIYIHNDIETGTSRYTRRLVTYVSDLENQNSLLRRTINRNETEIEAHNRQQCNSICCKFMLFSGLGIISFVIINTIKI